jgi:hypothetical protein
LFCDLAKYSFFSIPTYPLHASCGSSTSGFPSPFWDPQFTIGSFSLLNVASLEPAASPAIIGSYRASSWPLPSIFWPSLSARSIWHGLFHVGLRFDPHIAYRYCYAYSHYLQWAFSLIS